MRDLPSFYIHFGLSSTWRFGYDLLIGCPIANFADAAKTRLYAVLLA